MKEDRAIQYLYFCVDCRRHFFNYVNSVGVYYLPEEEAVAYKLMDRGFRLRTACPDCLRNRQLESK